MNARQVRRWLGGLAGFAASIALAASLAGEPLPKQGPVATPRTKRPVSRRTKRIGIPLQRNLRLAVNSNNEFRNPPEWDAAKGPCELLLTKDTFPYPGASLQSQPDNAIPQTFELLCYNKNQDKQAVGPTIRVRPGTTFKIHLHNALGNNVTPDPHPPDPPTYDTPHDLCWTNLHTHGLHVSPNDPSDNIFRSLKPGDDWMFEYHLPKDHPSGTFWYHPHRHGSVAYQLSNGLAGALIVEREKKREKNKPGDAIHNLEDIYEIARAAEKVMVLQLYNYRVGTDNVARIDASTIYNIVPLFKSCPEIDVTGPDPVDPKNPPQATAINGIIVPTIRMAPGEVQRWRIIHGSWDELKPLTFADKNDQKTRDLLFRQIAVDGLATGGMTLLEDNLLELAPGQRSDLLIQAPMLAKDQQEAVYFLKQDGVAAAQSLRGQVADPLFLAKIVVRGEPKPMGLPDPRALAQCRPFKDVEDYELSAPPGEFKGGIHFNGVDLNSTYNINYRTFSGYADSSHTMMPVRIAFGTAQEWTIQAAPQVLDYHSDGTSDLYPNNHPFHIHVNPFQVVGHTGADGKRKPIEKVWRDTLLIKGGESYTIRTRFLDFKGQTVLHCHILDHEDQGMMVPLSIDDPNNPAPAAKSAAGGNLKPASLPAPALKLPEPGGALRELTEFRRRNVVLVFFQGLECVHCAGQLRDLVRATRAASETDAEIVAVSSRRIADSARVFQALGVSDSDRFHLLVDEDHRAFRDFGCYDGGPRHGLFLIDRDGVIRAKYSGEAPFGDNREAVRQLRQLDSSGRKARR
jgi:FtsP/CotA-like multicopper oxidase with cupredoxin domain/peroxiredoxin